MQLKARVNSMAKEAGIPAQALMQSYLFERLLDRLSRSAWRDNVAIKGGVLISSLVGVSSRTTMDLDTTIRGFALTHESAERALRDIAAAETDDDWGFEFNMNNKHRVFRWRNTCSEHHLSTNNLSTVSTGIDRGERNTDLAPSRPSQIIEPASR